MFSCDTEYQHVNVTAVAIYTQVLSVSLVWHVDRTKTGVYVHTPLHLLSATLDVKWPICLQAVMN